MSQDFFVTVKRGEQAQISTEITIYDTLSVPITTDTAVGKITAFLDGQFLSEIELIPEIDVAKAGITDLIIRIFQHMVYQLTEGS